MALTKNKDPLDQRQIAVIVKRQAEYIAQLEKAQRVELALEQVRSAAMLMNHSNDLVDVVGVFFEQLKELNIPVAAVGISTFIEGSKDMISYVYGERVISTYSLPYFNNRIRKDLYNAREKGYDFFVGKYSKQEKNDFYNYLFEHTELKHLPANIKHFILQGDHYTVSTAIVKNSIITINDYKGNGLTENEIENTKRFAKVFDQAYTRFLDLQKAEVQAREAQESNKKLNQTLSNLKSAQAQLIQSEKMASLGELTAGIAHEIQNPLNFVNNFSEVSAEMVDEVHEELENGEITAVKEILGDLKQNLEKISHHGGRASSIVKGMLDHSRTTTGEKIPTDINILCDEYIRLSYHGLRAKDKSFNTSIDTSFGTEVGSVEIVPQEVGRVILNILNNAFFAVTKKKQTSTDLTFEPKVSLETKRIRAGSNSKSTVSITISDNGIGMTTEVQAKGFQPFFTTKPTGQGTGLGMSLSYDIITKGHGGKIEINSEVGKGTTFKILLPA